MALLPDQPRTVTGKLGPRKEDEEPAASAEVKTEESGGCFAGGCFVSGCSGRISARSPYPDLCVGSENV